MIILISRANDLNHFVQVFGQIVFTIISLMNAADTLGLSSVDGDIDL